MRDGYAIRRQGTETLVQAAERQGRPVSMLWKQAPILQNAGTALEKQVMGFYWNTKGKQCLHEDEAASDKEEGSETENEWEEENEADASSGSSSSGFEEDEQETTSSEEPEEGGLESDDETGYDIFQVWAPAKQNLPASAEVFEAERTIPTTRAARKVAFDGVLMPPLNPGLKLKSRVTNGAGKPPKEPEDKKPAKRQNASIPDLEAKGRTLKRHSMPERKKITMDGVPIQLPYDARNAKEEIRGGLDDIEMPDVSTRRSRDSAKNAPNARLDSTAPLQHKKTRLAPGQAAAGRAQGVSDEARRAYENCMKAPVQSTVGEMLAVSKELRTLAMDKIKTRAVKAVMMTRDRRAMVAHVAEYPWTEEDGILIKINMEIEGRTVVAVIDTGSQLDVIREGIADKVLNQPIDLTKSIQMNDANGGVSTLRGRADGVQLICGGVLTFANLYISNDKVPFDLLLGRRWQRRNLVGIDERKKGTYLIFKDSKTHQPRHELRVQTEMVSGSDLRSFRTLLFTHTDRTDKRDTRKAPAMNEDSELVRGGDHLASASPDSEKKVHEGEEQEKKYGSRAEVADVSDRPNWAKLHSNVSATPSPGDATVPLGATSCRRDHQNGSEILREEYISSCSPLVFYHHHLLLNLFTPTLSSTSYSNSMNEFHRPTSSPRSCGGASPPLSPDIPPRDTISRPCNEPESPTASLIALASASTLPSAMNIPTHFPRFAVITDEASRMEQVQFLNRDTFGEVGPVQRNGQGLTSYQVLYNAAATVREEYRQGEPPECNPLSVTSAQTEYLGIERDPYGREGHAFALLNADVTGHNSDLEEPFSLNGHVKIVLFTPPPAPGTPWALEAPYPSRSAIRYILQDYILPHRPYYAFPLHSTSILPSLDYLHPPAPPVHPPGIETPVNPDRIPSPSPNCPRVATRVPALEADTREIGRAINDSAISHFASQLPVSYDYIHRHIGESSSDVELSWDYTGVNAEGTRTWRRAKHPGPVAWRRPTLLEHSRLLVSCDSEGIPDVPDDTSDCPPWYEDRLLNSQSPYLFNYSRSPEPCDPNLPRATVVQIPDPEDRFSRPVERYSVPVYDETDYDRLARVAADLARDAREWGPRIALDSWQERRIAHRDPQPEVSRPTTDPSLTAKKPQIIRPPSAPSSDISSSSASNSDLEYLQYCADLDSNGSTGSYDGASSTGVIWIYTPSLLEDTPSRPSEDGDTYFPLTLPSVSRPPNPVLPGGRPLMNSYSSHGSMPELQSVSNSSDDDADSQEEELVTAPSPDPWDDNSSEESVQFSSDEDIPLFDSELQYPPSPLPRPVLCLRTPSLHLGSMPSSRLSTPSLTLDTQGRIIASTMIALPDDLTEPPLLCTEGQARMRWISRIINEESDSRRSSSPSGLTHTPLLRALSLSPPLPNSTSLINLPSTTPLLRPASPPISTRILRRFTRAALTGAEHVLRNITTAVQTSPAQNVDRSYRQLDDRIRDLEEALLRSLPTPSSVPSPSLQDPSLRDPYARFPLNEDLEDWTTTADQLAEILAEHLKEPRIFRAEISPIRDAELLLGFSRSNADEDLKSYHSFSDLPETYTPCPSPTYSSVAYTPCPSPTYTLPDELTPCSSPTLSLPADPPSVLAPSAESPIMGEDECDDRMGPPVTEEDQHWADRVFDFEFDFDSDTSTQDSESAAAREWLGRRQMEWIAEWTSDKSIGNDEDLWTPPSRRPMRNECGIVTYDRRRYGVVDFSEENASRWNWDERRRFETAGYALEFLDHFVLFSQSHLEAQLLPNLHIQGFNTTEQRLRTLEAAGIRTQASRIGTPPTSLYVVDEPFDALNDQMGLFLRFLQRVEQEYAADTQLSPITRASRYIPMPASSHFHDISPPDAEEVPAKRRKVEDSPLSRHVLQAATFKAAIIGWQLRFPQLRILRGDIKHGVSRLIEAIDFLDLRDRFRAIFFPFTENFEVFTVDQMFQMEQERNPDGYFRRNSYHLNSLLHDAEVNFFQACAILFRQEEFFDLAYCIEELLATRFHDDYGIAQLLRAGFLDACREDPEAIANQSYGTLADRLREMVDDWYPDNRTQTWC
ncbi:hypothetical protein C8R47DRAFT_1294128 [Mycena vitilis]|nr:hypothetical protein C8R47DRAFT_1294128 [Mycena vitilis]